MPSARSRVDGRTRRWRSQILTAAFGDTLRWRSRPGAVAAAALIGASAVTTRASAVECDPANHLSTCVDADILWPHAGGGPFLSLGSVTTTPAERVSFGLVLSYLSRPIGVRVLSPDPAGTTIYAIDNAIDASFLWAIGITDRLELTVVSPVTLYEDGAALGDVVGEQQTLPRSALRDTRFGLTFALLPRPRTGSPDGFAVTSRLEWSVPSGDRSAFAGEPTMVAFPSVVGDYRIKRFELAGEVGARIRRETQLATAIVGSEIDGSAGVAYDALDRHRLTVGLEAYLHYTLATQKPPVRDTTATRGAALAPAEWIASLTTAPVLAGDVGFSLGGGSSIPLANQPALGAPRFRFDFAVRYAPTGHDTDGDGIPDRDDKCPTVAEDRDGFQDADGCPDPDNDHDGIPDIRDRCPNQPETVDGYQDADGCPDGDDDHDGVPDDKDKCRNAPEDKDGFQDADGCPDPDNDNDGIPDVRDKCPNAPEDVDGFQDADGCPDPDNDGDKILDAQDKCPNLAEDVDGFQDADGCPDPDNDEDGILDADDKCPNVAETIDGNADDDGCPEPGARSLVRWAGERVVVEAPAAFAPGRADVSPPLERQLGMIAQLVRGHLPLEVVIVEAYGDRPGDASRAAEELAAKRASAVRDVLARRGIPQDRITAAAGDLRAKRPAASGPLDITVRRSVLGRTTIQEKH